QRRTGRGTGRRVRPGAGAGRTPVAAVPQSALALALALGRRWPREFRTDAVAPAHARRRAGAGGGLAGPGATLGPGAGSVAPARAGLARGLVAARRKARVGVDAAPHAAALAHR